MSQKEAKSFPPSFSRVLPLFFYEEVGWTSALRRKKTKKTKQNKTKKQKKQQQQQQKKDFFLSSVIKK